MCPSFYSVEGGTHARCLCKTGLFASGFLKARGLSNTWIALSLLRARSSRYRQEISCPILLLSECSEWMGSFWGTRSFVFLSLPNLHTFYLLISKLISWLKLSNFAMTNQLFCFANVLAWISQTHFWAKSYSATFKTQLYYHNSRHQFLRSAFKNRDGPSWEDLFGSVNFHFDHKRSCQFNLTSCDSAASLYWL